MPTIRQSQDFPNSEAHASAFYANGRGPEGADIYAWAGTAADATGPGLQDVWRIFQNLCTSGLWGAGYTYDGYIFPDAVVLRSGVLINSAGKFILWIIFAGTPSATYTPLPA